jgi:hypothetical protein
MSIYHCDKMLTANVISKPEKFPLTLFWVHFLTYLWIGMFEISQNLRTIFTHIDLFGKKNICWTLISGFLFKHILSPKKPRNLKIKKSTAQNGAEKIKKNAVYSYILILGFSYQSKFICYSLNCQNRLPLLFTLPCVGNNVAGPNILDRDICGIKLEKGCYLL